MPLHLRFASAKLRDICERRETADRLLGTSASRRLRSRLADIRAASDIRHVKVGRPKVQRNGRIAFHLSESHQLVVAPAGKPLPRHETKDIDWAAIDTFEIVEIT